MWSTFLPYSTIGNVPFAFAWARLDSAAYMLVQVAQYHATARDACNASTEEEYHMKPAKFSRVKPDFP